MLYENPIKGVSEFAQSCPTLCDPMVCSLPGSSIHRILQARVLDWVAISFSRGYLKGLVVFPTFFNLSLNLAVRNS